MFFKIEKFKDLDKLSFIMKADSIKDVYMKLSEMESFFKLDNKKHYYKEENSKITISRMTKEDFKISLEYGGTLTICKNSLKIQGKKVFYKYEVAFYGEDGRSHRTVLDIIWARSKKEANKIYKGQYDPRFEPLEKVGE